MTDYHVKKNRQIQKRERKLANIRKHNRYIKKTKSKKFPVPQRPSARSLLKRELYKKRPFYGKNRIIKVGDELGVEHVEHIENFFDVSNELLAFDGRKLTIDISDCKRVWPSGVTLLCGLSKWIEITSNGGVSIQSTIPSDEKVEDYLKHCGFYDFVGSRHAVNHKRNTYSENEIVKIERKKSRSFVEDCEERIVGLLEQYSSFSQEQIEWFNAVILTETFNNVIEHGVSRKDNGWWVLAQRHATSGFISICIADNGIGIRNSLMTGPQSDEIAKSISNTPDNDGEFINIAIKNNVSGASTASTKEGLLIRNYRRGSRRGHGLKLIVEKSKELGVKFTLLSHNGYFISTPNSDDPINGSRGSKVFPGTMYHFLVPSNNG